jgi:2-amino-4-hydroxy-6-hydroxymethyldihydropteridine diphosphokinase
MATGLIALGSNLGDPPANVQHALHLLDAHPDVQVLARSRLYQTQPIGGPQGQGAFVNAAATVATSLAPRELFVCLRHIETELGRRRRQRWAARVVDLDLLLYDDLVIRSPQLTIPHPRMAFRRFVLEPAAEVAPALIHPQIGWTMRQLLQHLNTAANYVALTGVPGTGKSDLARRAAQAQAGRYLADPAARQSASEPDDPLNKATARKERQRLEQRGTLLLRDRWQQPESPSISDFWFDQQLAYLQLAGDLELQERVVSQWQTWQDRIVHPKLLVMLVANTARPDAERTVPSAAGSPETDSQTADRQEELQTRLHALVSRPGQGPALILDAADSQWAFAELSAAVQAMQ